MDLKWCLVLAAVCVQLSCCESTDFYKLLGIERDADNREIRRAFKKLALTMHPDKNQVGRVNQFVTKLGIIGHYHFLLANICPINDTHYTQYNDC